MQVRIGKKTHFVRREISLSSQKFTRIVNVAVRALRAYYTHTCSSALLLVAISAINGTYVAQA